MIQAAHVARAKQIEARQADKPKAASKPSGKRARTRGGMGAERDAVKVA